MLANQKHPWLALPSSAHDTDESTTDLSLDGTPSVSVCSYNLLAQCLIRRSMFPFCTKAALKGAVRNVLVEKELAFLDTDIFCLQEVDSTSFNESLSSFFTEAGYQALFEMKPPDRIKLNQSPGHGIVVAFKSSQFHLVHSEKIFYAGNTSFTLNTKDSEEIDYKNIAILSCLYHFASKSFFIVSTTHLSWKYQHNYTKIRQISTMMSLITLFSSQCVPLCEEYLSLTSANSEAMDRTTKVDLKYIITGDFNSTTRTLAYNLAVDRCMVSPFPLLSPHSPHIDSVTGKRHKILPFTPYIAQSAETHHTFQSLLRQHPDFEPKREFSASSTAPQEDQEAQEDQYNSMYQLRAPALSPCRTFLHPYSTLVSKIPSLQVDRIKQANNSLASESQITSTAVSTPVSAPPVRDILSLCSERLTLLDALASPELLKLFFQANALVAAGNASEVCEDYLGLLPLSMRNSLIEWAYRTYYIQPNFKDEEASPDVHILRNTEEHYFSCRMPLFSSPPIMSLPPSAVEETTSGTETCEVEKLIDTMGNLFVPSPSSSTKTPSSAPTDPVPSDSVKSKSAKTNTPTVKKIPTRNDREIDHGVLFAIKTNHFVPVPADFHHVVSAIVRVVMSTFHKKTTTIPSGGFFTIMMPFFAFLCSKSDEFFHFILNELEIFDEKSEKSEKMGIEEEKRKFRYKTMSRDQISLDNFLLALTNSDSVDYKNVKLYFQTQSDCFPVFTFPSAEDSENESENLQNIGSRRGPRTKMMTTSTHKSAPQCTCGECYVASMMTIRAVDCIVLQAFLSFLGKQYNTQTKTFTMMQYCDGLKSDRLKNSYDEYASIANITTYSQQSHTGIVKNAQSTTLCNYYTSSSSSSSSSPVSSPSPKSLDKTNITSTSITSTNITPSSCVHMLFVNVCLDSEKPLSLNDQSQSPSSRAISYDIYNREGQMPVQWDMEQKRAMQRAMTHFFHGPEFTNFTHNFVGALDYILYSAPSQSQSLVESVGEREKVISSQPSTSTSTSTTEQEQEQEQELCLSKILRVARSNEVNQEVALPNSYRPSDHLPIAAVFQLRSARSCEE